MAGRRPSNSRASRSCRRKLGAIEASSRSGLPGLDEFEAFLVGGKRLEEVGGRYLAAPVGRAVVNGALRCIILGRKEVGTFQCVLDRADIRIGVGNEFRDPPTFNGAIGKDFGALHQAAGVDRLIEQGPDGVDPVFGGDVGHALLVHRGEGRKGVARDDGDGAAIAFFQNDLVKIGRNAGRGPFHLGNRNLAAFGGLGRRSSGKKSRGKDGRNQKPLHRHPQILLRWTRSRI